MTHAGLVVYHYPAPLSAQPGAGSQVRPVRMLEALQTVADEVVPITGWARDRRAAIDDLRRRVAGGARITACYGESTTMPTTLTEPHHLPTHPLLDARFFTWLKRCAVPSGIFYRDIHWRFPQYHDEVPLHQRLPALAAYRVDLWWYRRELSVLFLPSLRMRAPIPGGWPLDRAVELPPGGEIVDDVRPPRRPGALQLFYVGGVTAPRYDIRPLLIARRDAPGVELTICCPARERPALDLLGDLLRGVRIVHDNGDALRHHYAQADAACLVYAPEEYRSFAMPVKLFEAIGSGVPPIVSAPSSAADFVVAHGLGWTVHDDDSLALLLRRLLRQPEEVVRARSNVLAARPAHTWEARARHAIRALLEAPPRSRRR